MVPQLYNAHSTALYCSQPKRSGGAPIAPIDTGMGAGGVSPPAARVRGSRPPEKFYISNAKYRILVHSWLRKLAPATLKNLASKQALGWCLETFQSQKVWVIVDDRRPAANYYVQ